MTSQNDLKTKLDLTFNGNKKYETKSCCNIPILPHQNCFPILT